MHLIDLYSRVERRLARAGVVFFGIFLPGWTDTFGSCLNKQLQILTVKENLQWRLSANSDHYSLSQEYTNVTGIC